MSSFDKARKAIEGLWDRELADFQRRKQEAEARVLAARSEIERLRRSAEDAEAEAAALRGQLRLLPELLAQAQLEGDKKAQADVRARYRTLQEAAEELEGRAAASREELRALYGDDPEAAIEELKREGYPLINEGVELFRRIEEEHARLVELLDARLAEVGGRPAKKPRTGPGPAPPISLRLGQPAPPSAPEGADPRTVRLGR